MDFEKKPFVVQALDPFHDTAVQPTGFPGGGTSRTIVQRVKRQITIAVPAGVVGNYSAHVTMLPYLPRSTSTTLQAATFQRSATSTTVGWSGTAGVIGPAIGGVTILTAGDPNIPTLGIGSTTTLQVLNPTEFLTGPVRVVAQAFEVVNTTAEIYRQGSVSCYRVPTTITNDNIMANADTVPNYLDTQVIDYAPFSLRQINQVPGTTTWAAAEGVYVVGTYNALDNPLARTSYRSVVWSTVDDAGMVGNASQAAAINVAGTAAEVAIQASGGVVTPFSISGAYFSGLSNQTTLTITALWVLERAPEAWENDLVVLSQPAERYDEVAIALVMAAGEKIGPGTKVGNNASGDWWKAVRTVLRRAAGELAGSLTNMLVPGIGGRVNDSVLSAIDKRIAANEARRQQSTKSQKKLVKAAA